MGLESECDLISCFYLSISHKAVVKVLARATSQGLTEGVPFPIPFQVHSQGCWQTSEPFWLLTRDISPLLHASFHRAAHNMADGFPQSEWAKKWERVFNMEAIIFGILISKVTSVTSAAFYLLEESQSSAHIQGEGIMPGMNKTRRGSWKPSQRLPTTPTMCRILF